MMYSVMYNCHDFLLSNVNEAKLIRTEKKNLFMHNFTLVVSIYTEKIIYNCYIQIFKISFQGKY